MSRQLVLIMTVGGLVAWDASGWATQQPRGTGGKAANNRSVGAMNDDATSYDGGEYGHGVVLKQVTNRKHGTLDRGGAVSERSRATVSGSGRRLAADKWDPDARRPAGFYYQGNLENGDIGFGVASEPGPSLSSSEPPMDGTLPKIRNNVILLVFDREIALPASGNALSITEIGNSPPGGPEHGSAFNYSLLTTNVLNDTLKAKEDQQVLSDKTWYRIKPDQLQVQCFTLDVCTLCGDANGDGRVDRVDCTTVKAHYGEITDARYDIDGDGEVDSDDCNSISAYIFNQKPAKPLLLVADLDADGDVDLDDYVLFENALDGPGVAPSNPEADLDNDCDCDLADCAIFAKNFSAS